ncbi:MULTISPECIES: phosphotransferase family protein [unclassified Luteococcus]|uniref:phosphotransferase family protein n=1 Tax=unclassified Luteococcus TaxID=2639923 RepID=UPI00313DCF44
MELETRFARPDGETIATLVEQCAPGEAAPLEVIETGSSSVVALTEHAAVRIARDPKVAQALLRTQRLVDHLPPLPFDVPTSLAPPVRQGDIVAIATRRLHGEPHPAGSGEPAALRPVLDAIHEIDVGPVREWLAEPHAFSGGTQWLSVLREQVVPLLHTSKRSTALRIIEQAEDLDSAPKALNHGDLAGSNMLWQDGRVSAVLDWDLAAWCDPADDVASIALWHGWDLLPCLADAETVQRAEVIRQTYPMQIVAFSLLHERPADEVNRAVRQAVDRLP